GPLRQQARGPGDTGFNGKVPVDNDQLAPRSVAARAVLHAAQTVPAEWADQRTGDDTYMPMPQTIQVLHRIVGSRGVVDVRARNTEAGAVLAPVHDWRQTALASGLHELLGRFA